LLSAVGLVPNVTRGRDQLFVLNQPTSMPAEAIRLLRANIEFAATTREIETLMVTSAVPGEGKSTVTANLGIALAQAGYETIIVDADLRRPSQHRIFNVTNEKGLTTLLTRADLNWLSVATDAAGVPNLWLIPSGPIPPNPADLISLDRFGSVIREMIQAADIVLVDTSPVLAVSDPLVVSSTVRDVLVVSRANRTRTEALRRAVESLPKAPVRLIGVVVNQQAGRGSEGYYYYYSGEYGPNEGDRPKGESDKRSPAFGRFGKKREATAPS
jgi:capsular exopolysaccharide synthesis family protein